jgi:hypothetical protein
LKKVKSITPAITTTGIITITTGITTVIKITTATSLTKEGIITIIKTENNEWNISNKRRKKTAGRNNSTRGQE